VLTDLEVRKIESLQVADIDVGRHNLAARSDSLREPNGHGSPARANLKASPSRLDQFTSSRERVEDFFQETQPIVFRLLAPSRVESVTWFVTQRFIDCGCALAFYHCATIRSDLPSVKVRKQPSLQLCFFLQH